MMVENDCREYINIYSPVDNACHGFDLDCVAKAGKDILGDGARIAGNGDELYIFPLKTKNHIIPELKIILNKTKYFRLRLSDELSTERPKTDLRLT